MIQPNELRIGNWVTTFESQEPIELDAKTFANDVCRFGAQDLNPIHLTSELLERIGFELISKYSYWNFKNKIGFVLSMWMEDFPCAGFEEKGVCYYGDNYRAIKYLHELQNVYYFYVGLELEIKL